MRKILLIGFFWLFSTIVAMAENLSVVSFKRVDTDVTPMLNRKRDQNGDVSAMVKIITQGEGLSFKVAGLGIVDVEREIGEYRLYIPHGSRLLTIYHPEYEPLDYFFEEDIREGKTYEMRLSLPEKEDKIDNYVQDKQVQDNQYLVLKVKPIDAVVYIDNTVVKLNNEGKLSALLSCGIHKLHFEHNQYAARDTSITIVKDKRTELNIEMLHKAGSGSLSVQTDPMDAMIFLNGKQYGNTPQYISNLAEGKYEMQLDKKGYESIKLGIKIESERVQNMSLIMSVVTESPAKREKKKRESLREFIDDKLNGYVYWDMMKLKMYMGGGRGFDGKFCWTFRGDFFTDFRFHMFEMQLITIAYEIMNKRLFFEPTVGLHFPVADWCALQVRVGPSFTAKKSSDYLHKYFGLGAELAWTYYTGEVAHGEFFLHAYIPYNTMIRGERRYMIDMGVSLNVGWDI